MISIDEALGLILANLPPRRAEQVRFEEALGRVLAEDLAATQDMPPFDRSAMDGYALHAEDTEQAPARLKLTGEVRAGGGEPGSILPGEAKAIMTGAPVPQGADAVQVIERVQLSADRREVVILETVAKGENIRRRGSDAAEGDVVLEVGRVVGPAEIAVLAAFGRTEIPVWRKPSVAVISTGDEIVEVDEVPRAAQVRNSNAYSLRAQLRCMGIEGEYLGIAPDRKDDIRRLMEKGLKCDLLIMTGGVSVGGYDFVKEVFQDLGLEMVFSKVAVRPGKPTVFARRADRLVFGLPGNPVSAFMTFEVFIRPALGRLCGLEKPELPRITGVLQRDMRQSRGRTSFVPARASKRGEQWEIEPLSWHGSGDIIGFSRGSAAIIFPRDRDFLPAGGIVEAVIFPGFLDRSRLR
jgi:molybdopterin molybdotransferase